MAKKSKRSSLLGLLLAVVTIAVAVAGISTRRRHVDDAKWSDYDECGMI